MEAIEQYKLVVCDIDGTLLTKNGDFLPSTDETIRKLVKTGVLFATVSARTISHTKGAFPDLMELCCANAYVNGAYIEAPNGEVLVDAPIRDEDLSISVKELNRVGASYCCISRDDAVAKIHNPKSKKGFALHHGTFTERSTVDGSELKTYLIAAEAEDLQSVVDLVKKEELDVEATPIMKSPMNHLEVSFLQRNGTAKEAAIRTIAEHCRVDLSETIAIGDSMLNDAPMVEAAGCGVAMKNSPETLKEMAKYVTEKDNNEDGVGSFLRDLFRSELK